MHAVYGELIIGFHFRNSDKIGSLSVYLPNKLDDEVSKIKERQPVFTLYPTRAMFGANLYQENLVKREKLASKVSKILLPGPILTLGFDGQTISQIIGQIKRNELPTFNSEHVIGHNEIWPIYYENRVYSGIEIELLKDFFSSLEGAVAVN